MSGARAAEGTAEDGLVLPYQGNQSPVKPTTYSKSGCGYIAS